MSSDEECLCVIPKRRRADYALEDILTFKPQRKRKPRENGNADSSRLRPKRFKIRLSSTPVNQKTEDGIAWHEKTIGELPEELLLHIFSYLPLAMLLLVIRNVCKTWRKLALDWTLWKSIEYLRVKSMFITTGEVKTLLRTIPKLKRLDLVLRNDAEELLKELLIASENLEVLRLERCRFGNMLSAVTIKSILESCPRLKSVTLLDTYFYSREFYESLADRFNAFERINISCTTKSEMEVFVDRLKSRVSSMEFQKVCMMGKADGKQIYWGPILGLVVRPNPTSPYHGQHANSDFPNYVF